MRTEIRPRSQARARLAARRPFLGRQAEQLGSLSRRRPMWGLPQTVEALLWEADDEDDD